MIENDNTRLDLFVKESLNKNEMPFNESDWNNFEGKLKSKPSVNPFAKWSFTANAIIGLVAVGALSIGAVYTFSGNNNSPVQKQNPVQPKNETFVKTNSPVQNTAANNTSTENPVQNNTVVNNPVILTSSTFSLPQNNKTNETPVNTIKIKAPDNMSESDKKNMFSNIDDGNQTLLFPDQIDPKDGAIFPTQEPDCTKSKAIISGDEYKYKMDDSSKNGGDNNGVNPKSYSSKKDTSKKKKKKSDATTVDDSNKDNSTSTSDSTQNVNKKRNKNDNPKYKNKKNPNDPYSD